MDIVSTQQRKKLHPHKFTLWVAIGSIIMMFAGLTSAYIVKSNQTNWKPVSVPQIFWISTLVMVLSSLSLQMALRSFKQREMNKYRSLIGITLLLGIAFVVCQWLGFQELWRQQITFKGAGAGQFLYVIFGLHAIHVIGGVVAAGNVHQSFFRQSKIVQCSSGGSSSNILAFCRPVVDLPAGILSFHR
jgi:cytochrome c oxidase subunit 3